MKIQFHRIDTNVVVGLLVREFCCSGTDVSAKVLAMYADTRTPSMEPQWLAAGLSQDTSIYARGKRLEVLRTNGLLYKKNQEVIKAEIKILGELPNDDIYDFVLLTVRENQLYEALAELKNNKSTTIVTMINSLDSYKKWEDIVGRGRILPAFPGAGGSINEDGILDASLTPRIIQPTTFAEVSGNKSERTKQLSKVLKHSHIPCQKVQDMHFWR